MVYFQDTSKLSLASMGSMIPMIVGMFLVKPLVKKFGKKNLITWPTLGSAICYGATAFLPMTPMTWILCQIGATCCSTATGLLLWSLISDAVDYQAYITGVRNDGTVYATITFIVFFAASASTSIIALMLELLGYDASLGSMGQLAGVAERIKFFGGAWPMIERLSWSHFRVLLQVSDSVARNWYMNECANESWAVKTLQRNVSTQYYYRLLASDNKSIVKNEMQEKTATFQNDTLEFINEKEKSLAEHPNKNKIMLKIYLRSLDAVAQDFRNYKKQGE